jgi:hypothetical protein
MANIYESWKDAVTRSYEHYSNTISKKEYAIIDSYRGDVDPDDWADSPLLVSFQIMNWAIKKINKNKNVRQGRRYNKPDYLPALLTPEGLIESQIDESALIRQVDHAKILDASLHTFPRLRENERIVVYRGENCNSFYYQKAANMMVGEEIVILPFLSTSINQHVAGRFTSSMNANKACLWEIIIRPGQIFPYVSDEVPDDLGNENSAEGSEQEVLLPTHARLRLLSKSVGQSPKIYRFELVGFEEKSLDFWDKTLANLIGTLPASEPKSKKPKRGGTRKNKNKRKRRVTRK